MNSFAKTITCICLAIAALAFLATGHASSQQAEPASAEYPVLLVHGLGTGPGDAAFGKLQEYLEAFYFDVEVMDFDDYVVNKLVNHDDEDNIPVLAAVLGMKIKDMVKKYKTDKVNIIAHSFGGLIVQAYLLDKGKEFDPKAGEFTLDVARVLYLQVPFYGTDYDPEKLLQLANDTDYGPYTRPEQMVADLQYGGQMLFSLDAGVRAANVYATNVDMASFVSPNDDVVPERSGVMAHFTENAPFAMFRALKGYRHTNNPLSGGGKDNKVSIAYVEKLGAINFIAISSFIDGGRTWRKFPTAIDPNGIVMVKHSSGASKESQITLTMKKKINAPGAAKVKPGDTIQPFFDSKTDIFYFNGVAPGEYTLAMSFGAKKLNEVIKVDGRGRTYTTLSYTYDYKKNELLLGDGSTGSAKALYSLKELTFNSATAEKLTAQIKGLNTSGFEISFSVEGAQMETFNKGRAIVLYNQSGSQADAWQDNGGRLEIQLRGTEPDDDQHAGKIQIYAVADADKDGYKDSKEFHEQKTGHTWNWAAKHNIRLTVRNSGNMSIYVLYVNGQQVLDFDLDGAYYNPNPYISFGGREFDIDYHAPKGAKLTNVEIRNIAN